MLDKHTVRISTLSARKVSTHNKRYVPGKKVLTGVYTLVMAMAMQVGVWVCRCVVTIASLTNLVITSRKQSGPEQVA